MSNGLERVYRARARVIGCLSHGWLRVILCPGHGLADGGIPADIPINSIPFDLRMPNAEFFVLIDRDTGQFAGIEH